MDIWLRTGEMLPFISTTTLWIIDVLILVFILRRCRYITIDPTDLNKLVIGNFLHNAHLIDKKITILGKVWGNLYRVDIEGKLFFIFSSDQTVSEYKLDNP
ncbi:MAG: hypothetical protein ABJH04_21360 [Cyclobacteriaceae bacterium]